MVIVILLVIVIGTGCEIQEREGGAAERGGYALSRHRLRGSFGQHVRLSGKFDGKPKPSHEPHLLHLLATITIGTFIS